jgi:hypothetical protein
MNRRIVRNVLATLILATAATMVPLRPSLAQTCSPACAECLGPPYYWAVQCAWFGDPYACEMALYCYSL